MSQPAQPPDRLTLVALRAGVAVPLLYFGIQLLAAPFYPGYSFVARDASTLGSPGSAYPAIFNGGAILTGVAMLVAALGFLRALRWLGVGPIVSWLVTGALIAAAAGNFNAGLHPLPDPRHSSGLLASLGIGILLLPVLLPVALWRLDGAGALRRYLGVNLMVVLLLIPVMSGLVQRWSMMSGVEVPGLQSLLNNYQGVLQRVAALTVFAPIGIAAGFLARSLTRSRT